MARVGESFRGRHPQRCRRCTSVRGAFQLTYGAFSHWEASYAEVNWRAKLGLIFRNCRALVLKMVDGMCEVGAIGCSMRAACSQPHVILEEKFEGNGNDLRIRQKRNASSVPARSTPWLKSSHHPLSPRPEQVARKNEQVGLVAERLQRSCCTVPTHGSTSSRRVCGVAIVVLVLVMLL